MTNGIVNISWCVFKVAPSCGVLSDESGSDSDGAESTSSSYSSLSDFVIDIQNSEINGETPGETSTAHSLIVKKIKTKSP